MGGGGLQPPQPHPRIRPWKHGPLYMYMYASKIFCLQEIMLWFYEILFMISYFDLSLLFISCFFFCPKHKLVSAKFIMLFEKIDRNRLLIVNPFIDFRYRWLHVISIDFYNLSNSCIRAIDLNTSDDWILPSSNWATSKWFSPTVHAVKNVWRILNIIVSIWHENVHKYLSFDIICSSKHNFPRAMLLENCLLLRTDNVCGQICQHIFVPNGGYCLFIKYYQLTILRVNLPFLRPVYFSWQFEVHVYTCTSL